MFKPISISLSPNVEKDDIFLTLKTMFCFWKYKKGGAIERFENEFKKYLGVNYVFSFNSGRSSLFAILKSLNFNEGDEVLLQAFTCNASSNPIIWAGYMPIYVDCNEETFNIDVNDLEKKITSKSKAVIVQNTFGLPADMDKVKEVCKKHNLVLIEDCAHSLGAEYKGSKAGTIGDVSFFSFSRDKIISSVYGGMIATNNESLAEKIKKTAEGFSYPKSGWIFQQLLHPIFLSLILPFYGFFNIGKIKLVLFQKLGILSKAVHLKEKRGEMPGYFPKKLPNALAILALNQFKKLERFNAHRKRLADFYYEELKNTSFVLPEIPSERKSAFLRFAVKHSRAHEIIKKAWKENILIGDWYTTPIAPHDTVESKLKYVKGSCPKAERLSKITLNLPTHINIKEKELKIIISFLEECF
ncbi:unnamed protein product [marine sediment metagenome]|uniref:DegT/DnrJ/EryC1/StrS aminotransferase n=1 Tax=marine sediment metagenome TaxID=412755 RepID=X0T3I7_9ZZZZ